MKSIKLYLYSQVLQHSSLIDQFTGRHLSAHPVMSGEVYFGVKIKPTPLSEEPLKFIACGCIF